MGDKLAETFPTRLGYHRTTVLRAAGLGESRVDALIGDVVRGSKNPVLGFLAGPFETRILITSIAKDQSEADALEAPIIAEIVSRLGKNYVGRDEQTMLVTAASELKRRSLRLGLADSFTGGLAGQTFLRALDQDNLAGALSVPEKALPEAISFLFGQADADLVGVIQSAPESAHKTGPISGPEPRSSGAGPELTAKCRLLAKAPGGEVELASAVRTVGRNEAMATVRAGALLSLILWTHLTGGPGPH